MSKIHLANKVWGPFCCAGEKPKSGRQSYLTFLFVYDLIIVVPDAIKGVLFSFGLTEYLEKLLEKDLNVKIKEGFAFSPANISTQERIFRHRSEHSLMVRTGLYSLNRF